MRKAQKREVLEFINSLHQAHIEVKEALQQHNYDAAQNMLSECQEFAVALGENIEKLEGEGHITVSHVEEYCETLFWAFKEITDGQVNENKIYKILKRKLLNVENSVKNDIPSKKEIVFFPYKASMWDSLESVYLAAKEDPECDVYCIPIPYYDINPDHSFGRMHYEGNEYPEDIEIIDWQSYNFEERKPDVIYIHNPYDGCNLVTSVHPRYYSSNLKKYTDILVYIPYYVTSGGMLEAQSMLPAYLYADYIVIQSPQFRKHFDKSIPDEKFLPFGSPKIDKVINKCKNRLASPAGWTQKLIDRDGRRRRVFFITQVLMGENQKMIGAAVIRRGVMYIASLIDNKIYEWHIESGKTKIVELPIQNRCGFSMLIKHRNEIWGMLSVGKMLTHWNPDSGETREYVLDFPKEFTCVYPVYGYKCEDNPFGIPAFYGQYMYRSPSCSNMYLKLNLGTGELVKWQPSYIKEKKEEKFPVTEQSTFIKENSSEFGIFSYLRRKLYSINMETEVCKEIEIRFDMEDFRKHEMGFSEYSEGLKFMCIENCFNSLVTFLDGKITGGQFDRDRQLAAYTKTAANSNGSCGYKIHEFK